MRAWGKWGVLAVAVLLAGCLGGGPPDWTTGSGSAYPPETYLTGVGMSHNRGGAEDRARAEIARIFEVQVRERQTISESHWLSGGGAGPEYSQEVEAELTTSTDRILEGVRIAEVWLDEDTGVFYALAALERLPAARALRARVDELDRQAVEEVQLAETASSAMRRLGHYLQAVRAQEKRLEAAADLRILHPAGRVSQPPFSLAELTSRADRTAREMRVGVELQNDREGIVEKALVRALAGLGMQLAPASERDLTVRGLVSLDEYRAGGPWHWTVASAQVEFMDGQGALLDALRTNVKEGSRIASRSRTLARERLGRKLAELVVERVLLQGPAGGS